MKTQRKHNKVANQKGTGAYYGHQTKVAVVLIKIV